MVDKKTCENCIYFAYNYLTEQDLCAYDYYNNDNGRFVKIENITKDDIINGCKRFMPKNQKCRHYGYEIGDMMKNDDFKVTLRSIDYKKNDILTKVEVACENYDTFKQIIDAIMPIMEKEDIKKECD